MTRIKTIAILIGCSTTIATSSLFAATLQVGSPSLILMAGQTIEIPLSSDLPIASDLTASGAFEDGDVIFTAGPGCHLSANGCTLMITAAPTSKSYAEVPVMVNESAASNTPIIMLSIINPGKYASHAKISEINSPPLMLYKHPISSAISANISHSQTSLQRSGNTFFYGIAEPHSGLLNTGKEADNDFTAATNGPVYQIVRVTNHDATQALSVTITGPGANSFSLDNKTADYGVNQNCATTNNIASGNSCLVIVKGKVGDPRQAPKTATLTIQGSSNNVATFKLTDTTYVYAAGGFNTLGSVSVSGGDLLAQCTAGTCSNALDGSIGNNYASTHFSVGQWINALAVTPTGNLIVGGVFGAIGGATSGASSGTAALLAQCTPGSVNGNACINQMNGASNNYAFNNAYIDAITPPEDTTFMYLGGDFNQIRLAAVNPGQKILAKCQYNGITAGGCTNYMNANNKFANNAISAVDYLNSEVNVGGLFTQIAGYPSSAPLSGTTFASCTTSTCSQGMGSNNPNNSILGMTDNGTSLYMGGTFTQAGGYTNSSGGYTNSSGGYPLVICTLGTPTTCTNALADDNDDNDANGYIEGLTYSGGNLYVGGRFTTIGGAPAVSGGNMLAMCTPGGTCSNFVTGTRPYASGNDWGGNISAVAVGNQTTITAN